MDFSRLLTDFYSLRSQLDDRGKLCCTIYRRCAYRRYDRSGCRPRVTPANTAAVCREGGGSGRVQRREKETSRRPRLLLPKATRHRHRCSANRNSRGRRCRLRSAAATFTPSPSSVTIIIIVIIIHNDTTPTSSSFLLLLFFALVPYATHNTQYAYYYLYNSRCFVIVAQYLYIRVYCNVR